MVEWPSLFAKSDEERARTALQIATAVQRYAQASGRVLEDVMTVEEFRGAGAWTAARGLNIKKVLL